jgi:hypothetical protein
LKKQLKDLQVIFRRKTIISEKIHSEEGKLMKISKAKYQKYKHCKKLYKKILRNDKEL